MNGTSDCDENIFVFDFQIRQGLPVGRGFMPLGPTPRPGAVNLKQPRTRAPGSPVAITIQTGLFLEMSPAMVAQ